jgi:hypothetical protein
MNKLFFSVLSVVLMVGAGSSVFSQELSATEIVRRADDKFNGEKSVISTMVMTVIRPAWERTVEFRNWSEGRDNSLTLITSPARDQGESFL